MAAAAWCTSAVTLSRDGLEDETEADTSSGIVWSRREEGVVPVPELVALAKRPLFSREADEEKLGLEKLERGLVRRVEGKLRSADPAKWGTELMSL
jgi:hypothetical protein